MPDGLSRAEVKAFADMFGDAMSAAPLLDSIGLPRRSQPVWSGLTPETFWWEVSRLLAAGKVTDGRRRLRAAARAQYPANSIFAVGDEERAEPAVWKVPPRLAAFVGRERELAELAGKMTAGSVASLVALAGMGGVGKTALAVEYAWRHEPEFDVVWWIDAEKAEAVVSSLAELGEALGLAAGAEPAAVFTELRRRGRPWLVVFDNAEDLAAVAPFRPVDRRGRVLVTSRRTGWGALGATVQVPTLARAESVTLLTRRMPDEDSAVAGLVAELLGDLALALEQAAAFCEQNRMPLSELAELLAQRLDDLLDQGTVADRAGATVATLWEMSTERLAATAPAAVELLELLALCAPDPLPLDLFDGHGDLLGSGPLAEAADDRLGWVQTVGALIGYSLASRDTTTVWVHRLVQAATGRRLNRSRRAELLGVLLSVLCADLPGDVQRSPEGWTRWRALLPHVRSVLAQADDPPGPVAAAESSPSAAVRDLSWLCDRTATFLQEHAQLGDALPLFERALAISKALYGPDHPVVATRLNNLALALQDLGRAVEAVPLFQRALAIDEAVYGLGHPSTAGRMNNLAGALQTLGRAREALPLLRWALAVDEAIEGPDAPVVATALNNLALTLQGLGQTADALPLLQRALAIDEAVYGPDHPEVAADLANLASTLQGLGRAGEALPLFQRTLAIVEAVYGPDHPNTAGRLNNLAGALRTLGRPAEALPLFQRALAIVESVYGPDHANIVGGLHNLALVLQDLGRVGEALPLLQRALAIDETGYALEHPHVAISLNNLAGALQTIGRAKEALPLFQRALDISEAVYGPDHPVVATRLNNLALTLQDLDQTAEALTLLQRALAIDEAAYGPAHPEVSTDLNNLALTLQDLGRVGEALPLFQKALAIIEVIYGPDHPSSQRIRHNLVACEAVVTGRSDS